MTFRVTSRWLSTVVCALALCACGNAFQASTPPGFVELPDQEEYAYRATNADGLVVAVRELEHEPKGELSFWTKAIEKQLRERAGYALLGTRDVKAKTGESGKQLRFGHDQGKTPYVYTVTVFATDDNLFVIEAGGTKALMDKHAAQLDWTIANFRID